MLKELIKKSENSLEVECISNLYIDGAVVGARYLISSDRNDYKIIRIKKGGEYSKPKYFSKRVLNPVLDNSFETGVEK